MYNFFLNPYTANQNRKQSLLQSGDFCRFFRVVVVESWNADPDPMKTGNLSRIQGRILNFRVGNFNFCV
jgi:hypothetical protein